MSIIQNTSVCVVRNVSTKKILFVHANGEVGKNYIPSLRLPMGQDIPITAERFLYYANEIRKHVKAGEILIVKGAVEETVSAANLPEDVLPPFTKGTPYPEVDLSREAEKTVKRWNSRLNDPTGDELVDNSFWFIDKGTGDIPVQDIDFKFRIGGSTHSIFDSISTQPLILPTSSGVYTLTDTIEVIVLQGSTPGQILRFANATTISSTKSFYIINDSTTVISIQNAGSVELFSLKPTQRVRVRPTDISTANGQWTFDVSESTDNRLETYHTLIVKKNDAGVGEFTSIKAAVDSITDNSSTSQYLIKVGPGVFIEDTITMKPFVRIEGSGSYNTTLSPSVASSNILIGSENSEIRGFLLTGSSALNAIAVLFQSSTATDKDGFFVSDCRFGNNYQHCLANGSLAPSAIFLENCKFGSHYVFVRGFEALDGGRIVSRNCTTTSVELPLPEDIFLATGTGSQIVLNGVQMRNGNAAGGNAIRLNDGALLRALSTNIKNFSNGIFIENVGDPAIVDAVGILCEGNITDIRVEHPDADGTFNGSADHTKIIVNPLSGFSVIISCNHMPTDGTGSITVGDILQGDRYDRLANLSKLAREATTLGVISGGSITVVSGLTINISAGVGFLEDPIDFFIKEINWVSTNVVLGANVVKYIYVNTSGAILTSDTLTSLETTIPLGRVVTTATDIRFIEESSMRLPHVGNSTEEFLRHALGAVFAFGSVPTESGTRNIDITGGEYYFGTKDFMSFGGSAISWTAFYRDGGSGWSEVGQNTVDNAFYDDGSGTLAAIPAGRYAKHVLYMVGDSVSETYFLVYAQSTQNSLTAAVNEPLPVTPTYLTDAVVKISGIIVQQGVATISTFIDLRPRVGFAAPATTASSIHGNLSGLLADDHPQYIKANGTRAMSGNLDMGGNSITNVNLVDGVDVPAHASRHLPSGADPITTAIAVGVSATTSNSIGTDNSLARSDHGHAVATGAVASQTPDQANAAGSSSNLARADHVHNIATAAASGLDTTSTSTQGVAATFSRADHTHAIASGAPASQSADQANAAGVSANFAKADHVHNIATAAPTTNLTATTTNTQGVATTFSKSDHSHAITTGAAASQSPDQANAAGVSASLARADHVHSIPTATASTIKSNANAQGVAATFARADHSHQLTNSSASLGHLPRFDGSQWEAAYPEYIFDIKRGLFLDEDWINGTAAGKLNWTPTTVGGGSATGTITAEVTTTEQGVAFIRSGNAAARSAALSLSLNQLRVSNGVFSIETKVRIQTLSDVTNEYDFRFGLGDSLSADFTNGIYFQYDRNTSVNWVGKTANAATRTTLDSTSAVGTTWVKLRMEVNAAASSVEYFLNDVSFGTIATNIPTANPMGIVFHISASAAAATRNAYIDYFILRHRSTTTR